MKASIITLFVGLTIIGCKKTSMITYQSQGTITGYDPRECATCGGLEIVIKNDTTKNAPPFYDINSTLTQLGISESAKFPINVSLNWQHATLPNQIIVSRIKVD